MPELRKDPVIGRWVIVSTERRNRPGEAIAAPPARTPGAPTTLCPFCEGNESQTPPEVLAFRDAASQRDGPGWWVRVVPNKFPALQSRGDVHRRGEGIYDMMNGIGSHEVAIECPNHDLDMADMTEKQIEEILWVYRERMIELHKDRRFRYILIFNKKSS